MKDCKKCQSYKNCEGHYYGLRTPNSYRFGEWYSYSEIRFCPYHIKWIIQHSDSLSIGIWPDAPSIMRTDRRERRNVTEASFVKLVSILSEVEARLANTGTDGKLLKAETKLSRLYWHKSRRLLLIELSPESETALYYIAGEGRKTQSYSVWKAKRNYRQRGIKIYPKRET